MSFFKGFRKGWTETQISERAIVVFGVSGAALAAIGLIGITVL